MYSKCVNEACLTARVCSPIPIAVLFVFTMTEAGDGMPSFSSVKRRKYLCDMRLAWSALSLSQDLGELM